MEKRYKKDMSRYEGLKNWERLSISEQLKRWAVMYSDRIAVADSDEEITYAELNERADKMARAFVGDGIKKGDKVLIQLPNRISYVVSLFAVMRAGAVPILSLPAHRESELCGIAELAEPVAYISAERYLGYDYLPLTEKVREKCSSIKMVYIDGEKGGDKLLSELVPTDAELPVTDGYETAVLLLSGGTTGVPKLIPRTHTDYMYNARNSADRCGVNKDSVYLAALPAAHNFPLSCPGLLGVFDKGGKVVLSPTTSPDDILELITEHRVTITALVPAMVNICLEMLECDDEYDISSLKILQVGGAVLEDSLADMIISRLPGRLMQVFGTAEGLICFTDVNDPPEIISRCQGKPISEADEVKIVDEGFNEVADGVYGELIVRGPYTIDGYYKAEKANEESFTSDGFYLTGDKAMWTPEGNLRLGGRIKEQINRAGEKIMPSEVEASLCRHDNIKEAAVVGIPDKLLGNRICAFVMTNDGEEAELAEIRKYLQDNGMALYKLPDQIETVEIWPLTSVGKIDKKALQKMAE